MKLRPLHHLNRTSWRRSVQLVQLNLLAVRVYLGSRVGHAVGHVANETAHVAILDELRHALGDIIEEAHGVPQEVHGAQDLGRLADQLLRSNSHRVIKHTRQFPQQHVHHLQHPKHLQYPQDSQERSSTPSTSPSLRGREKHTSPCGTQD